MASINYFDNFSFYFPGSLNEVCSRLVLRIALKKAVGKPGTILQCSRFGYLTLSICWENLFFQEGKKHYLGKANAIFLLELEKFNLFSIYGKTPEPLLVEENWASSQKASERMKQSGKITSFWFLSKVR